MDITITIRGLEELGLGLSALAAALARPQWHRCTRGNNGCAEAACTATANT